MRLVGCPNWSCDRGKNPCSLTGQGPMITSGRAFCTIEHVHLLGNGCGIPAKHEGYVWPLLQDNLMSISTTLWIGFSFMTLPRSIVSYGPIFMSPYWIFWTQPRWYLPVCVYRAWTTGLCLDNSTGGRNKSCIIIAKNVYICPRKATWTIIQGPIGLHLVYYQRFFVCHPSRSTKIGMRGHSNTRQPCWGPSSRTDIPWSGIFIFIVLLSLV